jgi:hypothetical protein
MEWNGMEWNGMEWNGNASLGKCVQRPRFSRKELKDIFSVYYEKVRASTFSPL